MNIYINSQYRIKRSAEQQVDMKRMIDAHIFDQYKDILMISALLGFKQNCYVPIKKAASDGVLMQFFNTRDSDFIDYIAYAYKQEQGIVRDDEKYEIFSSFANGGFPILKKSLDIPDGEITPEIAKKALVNYYTLLLSDDFVNMGELKNKELDRELFK